MSSLRGRVTFGAFELDLESARLCKAGRVLKLRPQPMRLLCLLVSQAGRLVERKAIQALLWGDATFVEYDVGVDYCVYRIRTVLGDDAKAPRFVETIAGRGYRFIAPVTRQRPFEQPTLAVLPFANLNGDADKEYVADGLTDTLITELAHIPTIRVISRQSVLHLKGSHHTLGEIVRDLSVDGVVEGTVLHEGRRARLTAQLILADPERHAWADSYDFDMSAVLTMQRDVARTIAGGVASTLGGAAAGTPHLTPAATASPEVSDAFLNARTEFEKMSAEGISAALHSFREITLRAPDFAPGLAWYAACLFMQGYWGQARTSEVYPAAKHLALQALALDQTSARAHLVLAWMSLLLDWDLEAAMRETRHALDLSPSDTDAHSFYSTLLCFVGREADSVREVEYMLALNPAPLLPNQYAAWMFLHLGQHARAESQARRTITLFPGALQPYFVLGWSTWYQGRAEEAVAALETALSHSREALSLAYLGHVYGRLGRTKAARCLLEDLEHLRREGRASPTALATIHSGLGNLDTALQWLDTAVRIRDGSVFWLPGAPGLDPLHADSRFADLLRRIGVALPDRTRFRAPRSVRMPQTTRRHTGVETKGPKSGR